MSIQTHSHSRLLLAGFSREGWSSFVYICFLIRSASCFSEINRYAEKGADWESGRERGKGGTCLRRAKGEKCPGRGEKPFFFFLSTLSFNSFFRPFFRPFLLSFQRPLQNCLLIAPPPCVSMSKATLFCRLRAFFFLFFY